MDNQTLTVGSLPLLIDAIAARAMLCMSARRLWTLSNCQAVPSYRVGRSVRYAPTELAAWVACGCPTEPGSAARVRRAVQS